MFGFIFIFISFQKWMNRRYILKEQVLDFLRDTDYAIQIKFHYRT